MTYRNLEILSPKGFTVQPSDTTASHTCSLYKVFFRSLSSPCSISYLVSSVFSFPSVWFCPRAHFYLKQCLTEFEWIQGTNEINPALEWTAATAWAVMTLFGCCGAPASEPGVWCWHVWLRQQRNLTIRHWVMEAGAVRPPRTHLMPSAGLVLLHSYSCALQKHIA